MPGRRPCSHTSTGCEFAHESLSLTRELSIELLSTWCRILADLADELRDFNGLLEAAQAAHLQPREELARPGARATWSAMTR